MIRHALRTGEALAISPDAIHHDAAGFFLSLGPSTPDNERLGTVVVVHIRGALTHFDEGGGDSYEAIVKRVRSALEGEPSAVVFRIESPGGVVSGLNECVATLQTMSKDSGVPFVAFVDEMAASAAYAMCCACGEIVGPPSAIIGSVGVISTMVSVEKQDRMNGVEFRLITSGARKADGHPHAPLTDAAEGAERERNDELAGQFFALAGKARSMSPTALAKLEAAIFLADRAVEVGLADDVMGWADVCLGLGAESTTDLPGNVGEPSGNVTDRRAKEKALDKSAHFASPSMAHDGPKCAADLEGNMSVKLQAIVAKMAAETDPVKITALLAEYGLAAPRAGGDPEDKGDKGDHGEDGEDDEDEAKKAAAATKKAQGKADAAKHRAKAAEHRARAAESEEEARKCEADGEDGDGEDKAKKAAAALCAAGASDAAASAIAEQARIAADAVARVDALEAGLAKREQAATIKEALADGRITPAEAKMLGGKTPEWSAEYIDTRKGVRVVHVEEGTLIRPRDAGTPTDNEASEVNGRIAAMGVTDPKLVEKLRADMIANRRKAEANGAGPGRY